MAHQPQVVGRREAAGAAAHDGHALAGVRRAGRVGHKAGVVDGELLEAADVDGVVDHAAAAAGLAGMLADVGAGRGEGVVLADELDRVGVPPLGDQGHVAGDVHAGGTQRHAGHRVFQAAQAAALGDVGDVVIPEAPEPQQHLLGRVHADGAVGGVVDDPGRGLDGVDGLQCAGSIQHLAQQRAELAQAHPAGDALAAGLGVAEV